ncbi:MAG TPA: VOC family protein [Streptosporangiaceae bacterium]|nr:VOC family protein [Streptosporangiaceae bacterium]
MGEIKLRFPQWIGVVCADFDAQRRFYRDVLALRETGEGDGWVQFDLGTGVTFEVVAQSADPEYDRPRYQVGFVVDDIRATTEELIGRGIEPVTEIKGDASYWAYFRDPEGNVFEITERHEG